MKFKSSAWLGWTISGVLLVGVLITAVLASEGLAADVRSGVGPITELTLQEVDNEGNPLSPLSPVIGGLAEGYSLTLDGTTAFKYLDVDTLTASPALADGRYDFYFDHLRVPDGYFSTYWAGKGVVAGATGWQSVMWEIINGRQPMFYLDVSTGDSGTLFKLIDGLLAQTGQGDKPLQVSQDYPLATYHFGGYVTQAKAPGDYVNVQITFTRPATASLRTAGNLWTIDGCGYLDVYIHLADVHDLYALDFELSFDPDVLEVVDMDPSTPLVVNLDINPAPTFFVAGYVAINQVDNTQGKIQFVATQTNTTEPAQGAGDVAMIRFRAKTAAVNTPVTITKVELSDRDGYLVGRPVGYVIPAATITTQFTAAGGLDLDIIRLNASTVQLQWPKLPEGSGIDRYILHKSTLPYFEVGEFGVEPITTGFDDTVDPITYNDPVLGNVDDNYFYALQVECESGFTSPASQQVGKFEYELFETATTDFTWVGLVLEIPNISNTFELAFYIQNNIFIGSVEVLGISRWNPSGQTFTTYTHDPINPSFTFDVAVKQPFRVSIDIEGTSSGNVIWTQVGRVPEITQGTYSLYETGTTDFNWILQPLDMVNITNTTEFRQAINSNDVEVLSISRWNSQAQSFTSDTLGSFDTRFGYPYRIAVDIKNGDSITWP